MTLALPDRRCRPYPLRATLRYVDEVTHRELRNGSGNVLRRAREGETLLITNHGVVTATIGPPPKDILSDLSARGMLRDALADPSTLKTIRRHKAEVTSAEIVSDVRGSW